MAFYVRTRRVLRPSTIQQLRQRLTVMRVLIDVAFPLFGTKRAFTVTAT